MGCKLSRTKVLDVHLRGVMHQNPIMPINLLGNWLQLRLEEFGPSNWQP